MAKRDAKDVLSVRVSTKLLERLDQLCEKTDLTRSELVERCLSVGILDEEEFVTWAESNLKGALLSVMLRPSVFKAFSLLTGDPKGEVDETQYKAVQNVRSKLRQKRLGGRPATAT